MSTSIGKGIFLVASPALRDPNFRQSVVLLCEHSGQGALGVVVNRPTHVSLSEALPQIPVIEGQQHVLFSGGPVQPNQVLILYHGAQAPDASHHVFDGVYMGGDLVFLERALVEPGRGEAFRAYIGYSGWGPGQLEAELKTGAWLTAPADPATVFEKNPSEVWAESLKSFGSEYEVYTDMPTDPSLN